MPTEADQQSKGFMFVTLNNPAEAQAFQRAMHDLKFDKRHTFRVIPFTDVDKFENLDETYQEPPKEDWKPRVSSRVPAAPRNCVALADLLALAMQEHFRAWLADPAGRDQFVMYRGDDVQIAWNNRNGAHDVAHERSVRRATDTLIRL